MGSLVELRACGITRRDRLWCPTKQQSPDISSPSQTLQGEPYVGKGTPTLFLEKISRDLKTLLTHSIKDVQVITSWGAGKVQSLEGTIQGLKDLLATEKGLE